MKHFKISHSMSRALSLALAAVLFLTLVPVTLTFAGFDLVCDDGDTCFSYNGGWNPPGNPNQYCKYAGDMRFGYACWAAADCQPDNDHYSVFWRPSQVAGFIPGNYEVFAYISRCDSATPVTQSAKYYLRRAGDSAAAAPLMKTVNQAHPYQDNNDCSDGARWVSLGTHYLDSGTYVELRAWTDESGPQWGTRHHVIFADAVKFSFRNQPPNMPQQVAPANGSVACPSVTLQVQDRGDLDNYPRNYRDYYYCIEKTDGSWSQCSGWTTSTSWAVTVPSNGNYRWRAQSGDGELGSGWTGWWTLIIPIACPVPPPTPPPGGSCPVPHYWQQDPRWASIMLPKCDRVPIKLGDVGCALSSEAMVFKYYGVNHDPGSLGRCLGTVCITFAPTCSGGKVAYTGPRPFNWTQLAAELQQGRPVILRLKRTGGMHFVVAVSGSGTSAQNYRVNDPALKQGARVTLSAVLARRSYTPDQMYLFSGTPSCQVSSVSNDEQVLAEPKIELSQTQLITGTIIPYRNTETTMVLEITAQSSAGNVTEMLIWTNSITNTTWQPFAQYVELPLSEEFFVQFRDDAGNVSVPISNTSDPVASPPESNAVFLPLIMR